MKEIGKIGKIGKAGKTGFPDLHGFPDFPHLYGFAMTMDGGSPTNIPLWRGQGEERVINMKRQESSPLIPLRRGRNNAIIAKEAMTMWNENKQQTINILNIEKNSIKALKTINFFINPN